MGGCRSSGRSKKAALIVHLHRSRCGMNQRIGTRADGRLSLCEGEGEGEGLVGITARIELLTFILSPSPRREVEQVAARVVKVRLNVI